MKIIEQQLNKIIGLLIVGESLILDSLILIGNFVIYTWLIINKADIYECIIIGSVVFIISVYGVSKIKKLTTERLKKHLINLE